VPLALLEDPEAQPGEAPQLRLADQPLQGKGTVQIRPGLLDLPRPRSDGARFAEDVALQGLGPSLAGKDKRLVQVFPRLVEPPVSSLRCGSHPQGASEEDRVIGATGCGDRAVEELGLR